MKVKTFSTKFGDCMFAFYCLIVALICVIPMLNLLAKSLSGTEYLVNHSVYLFPKGFNTVAYQYVFKEVKYIKSFFLTAGLTVVCTFVSLTITSLCAYPMIYKNLKGRGILNVLIVITMFFNAGTIPNYILMKNLHLLDNILVLIIPSCLSIYNMIIMRSFFYGIPDSLRESAEIDGASFFKIFFSVYLPLSKPVYATLALFYAVGRWNGYTDALMYITPRHKELYPLQLFLYNIVKSITDMDVATQEGFGTTGLNESMKDAVVMFSTIPILIVYPFLQKYFIAGATLGAVKE